MTDHCPHCNVALGDKVWKNKPESRVLAGPWSPLYELWTGRCPKCGDRVRSLIRDFDSAPVIWMEAQEKLRKNEDYRVVNYRLGGIRNHELPVNVLWYWQPMGDDNFWLERMAARMSAKCQEAGQAAVLVVGPDIAIVDITPRTGVIHEIWRLESSVMQGASGPHPSARAELSLWASLPHQRINRIYHCWPSATLNQSDYVPLGTDEELAKGWASYQRQKIRVQINKEST